MSRTRARLLALATFVASPVLFAAGHSGCTGDTSDIFSSGSGGEGGAGSTSSSSKATSSVASTSAVTTTTSTATSSSSGPACGNGLVDGTDQCDGFDLDGQSCVSLGFDGGQLDCTAGCLYDTSNCSGGTPVCNNGVIEAGEECDGMNLGGATCANFGFTNPAGLGCDGCQLDPSGCKPTCGNGDLEDGEACDDDNTVAGDGCSPTCTLEMPTGNGASCNTPILVSAGFGTLTFTGTTVGAGAHSPSGCPFNGGDGPDRVYAITPQASGFLTATLPRMNATFDSVLWFATSCGATQINATNCNDAFDDANNQAINGGEVVSLRVQAGTTYYLFVDTYSGMSAGGTYQLLVNLSAGTCADPVPVALEPGVPMTLRGSNINLMPLDQGSCGGNPGGEVTYRVTPNFTDGMTIATNTNNGLTNYNAVLYARETCNAMVPELACSNQGGTSAESINVDATSGTPFFVKIDGSQSSAFGNYAIVMDP